MQVGVTVFFRQVIAAGAIRMLGVNINNQLVFSAAKLTGADKDGYALSADGMKVGGDVFLDEKFTAAGGPAARRGHRRRVHLPSRETDPRQ